MQKLSPFRAKDLALYLVLDEGKSKKDEEWNVFLQEVITAGVSMIQLREKHCSTREFIQWGQKVMGIVGGRVPVIVNDRVDVAIAINADGVHVGQSDMPASIVRGLIGTQKILGLSIENEEQLSTAAVEMAKTSGVDYLGIGPIFATPTKSDAAPAIGFERLQKMSQQSVLPIVAIGGINEKNAQDVMNCGVDGIAVVSAINAATNPEKATLILRGIVDGRRELSRPATCLTIAGSDSGGGAGIQADLKTYAAHNVFGMSVITALTSQNTQEVRSIADLPSSFVQDQLDVIFEDFPVDAVKIGMLSNVANVKEVAKAMRKYKPTHIVLDPVMIAKSQKRLLSLEAMKTLQEELIPLATLLTPNIPEANWLLGWEIKQLDDFIRAAREIQAMGVKNVLIKGGHFAEGEARTSDLLYTEKGECFWYERERVKSKNTHGTGCTFSSAIAANLVKGKSIENAVASARVYLQDRILKAQKMNLGKGHGPLFH